MVQGTQKLNGNKTKKQNLKHQHRPAKKQLSKVDALKRAKKHTDPLGIKETAKDNMVLENTIVARASLQNEMDIVKPDKHYVALVKEGRAGLWDSKKTGSVKQK